MLFLNNGTLRSTYGVHLNALRALHLSHKLQF